MFFDEASYKEYKHVITKAYEIHDDEALKRLEYVKKNVPTVIYNMFLLETLQWQLCILSSKRLDFKDSHLELICRVLSESIGKLENETKVGLAENAVDNA